MDTQPHTVNCQSIKRGHTEQLLFRRREVRLHGGLTIL